MLLLIGNSRLATSRIFKAAIGPANGSRHFRKKMKADSCWPDIDAGNAEEEERSCC
jgi:hypothetical protein